jgi:amidophosphoribosyltransferase
LPEYTAYLLRGQRNLRLAGLGPMEWREVEPGECVIIDDEGTRSFFLPGSPRARCIFEAHLLCRPDSCVFGRSVHAARRKLGEAMADRDDDAPDVVVPVPDSGTLAAMGYAAGPARL